ncbi:Stk1 family PASTA domain-containing Ser/Thr kinase [Brevibacterium ravenspurgense]|nr:Stk1 family PASTA domain-containing Ser/Thr kinase [Brevibacterium ravenspurgense]
MPDSRLLLGRYEIKELLGRGGMAEVHAGTDRRLGRRVAIKLLRSDLARDNSFHERINREAQSAARLNHPGIVSVYDSGEEAVVESGGGEVMVPFIVMEYVEGQTLREVLSTHGPLTVQESLDIIAGVLAPLDYSHRNGIVHRDIKPANVMLTPEGDIKVMDFGIARALEDTGSLTQTSSVVGTAQYLSPEQARGEVVDARSDLYSTACLLYELLTGQPPFTGDSQLAVAYQHVGETPRPPSEINPNIPPSVDRLVLHALSKSRDERYQDAFTFREDVLAARDGRPMSIDGGDSNATQIYTPAPATAATQMVAPVGVGTGPQTMGPHDELSSTSGFSTLPNRDEEEEKDKKKRSWLWILATILVLVLGGLGLWVYQLSKPQEPPTIELADLKDVSEEEALKWLADNNLNGLTEEVNDDDVEEGNVVKTDPEGGSVVQVGSDVTVFVSVGPAEVTVPDVSGQTESLARQTLEEAGLKGGSNTEENSPDVDKGTVLKTKPGKDSKVEKGSAVDLVLSSGRVDVPDVTGKTADEACEILTGEKHQLQCNTEEVETNDHEAGKVFSQSVKGGSSTEQHATITIKVAKEKPTPTPTPTPADDNTDDEGSPLLPGADDDS